MSQEEGVPKIQDIVPVRRRFFFEAIDKTAKEQGIGAQWLSGEWICRLEKEGRHAHIYGFNFPLNSAAAWEIARDKAAVSELLTNRGIRCAKHLLLMQPSVSSHVRKDGDSKAIEAAIRAWGFPMVCKDNRGAGGKFIVLEVNTGISAEHLVSLLPETRPALEAVYGDIVARIFERQ